MIYWTTVNNWMVYITAAWNFEIEKQNCIKYFTKQGLRVCTASALANILIGGQKIMAYYSQKTLERIANISNKI